MNQPFTASRVADPATAGTGSSEVASGQVRSHIDGIRDTGAKRSSHDEVEFHLVRADYDRWRKQEHLRFSLFRARPPSRARRHQVPPPAPRHPAGGRR